MQPHPQPPGRQLGDGYSILVGLSGHDFIADRAISQDEKLLYMAAGAAPFVTAGMLVAGKGILHLAPRGLDALHGAWNGLKGSRFADEVGDLLGRYRTSRLGSEAGSFDLGRIANRFRRGAGSKWRRLVICWDARSERRRSALDCSNFTAERVSP